MKKPIESESRYQDAKLLEVTERARRIKIKNDRAESLLITRAAHDAEYSEMTNASQTVLGRIPARLAVEVVVLSVPEVEIRIQAAIDEALHALRNWPE